MSGVEKGFSLRVLDRLVRISVPDIPLLEKPKGKNNQKAWEEKKILLEAVFLTEVWRF